MILTQFERSAGWQLAAITAGFFLLAGTPGTAPVLAGAALALATLRAGRGDEAGTFGLCALASGLCWVAIPALAVAFGWAAGRRVQMSELAIWGGTGFAIAAIGTQVAIGAGSGTTGLWTLLPLIGLGWAAALPAAFAIGVMGFLAARMSIAHLQPGQFGLAVVAAAALAVAALPAVDSRAIALPLLPAIALLLSPGARPQRLIALLVQCVVLAAAVASATNRPMLETVAHAALLVTGCLAARFALANAVNDNPFLARILPVKRLSSLASD